MAQIGFDDGIDKSHQHRTVQILARQVNGGGLAVQLFLPEIARPQVRILLGNIFLNLLAQMADNKDDLVDVVEGRESIQHMAQHRFAGHIDQRLGLGERVWPEAFAETSERNDDLHNALSVQ